jgi:cytoskeletal protein RodZ
VGQFGEELRRERVSRGIALETISNATKVVRRYLTALEDEHFEVLPGGILSKGIVRSYARVVGLDEGAWVERFLVASNQQGRTESDSDWARFAQNVSEARVKDPRRAGMGRRWTGIAVLLVVLAGFGWFVWRYVSGRALADAMQQRAVTATASAATGSDSGQ